jgi:hypothetical protein
MEDKEEGRKKKMIHVSVEIILGDEEWRMKNDEEGR